MKTSIIKIPKGFQVKEVRGSKIILEKKEERLTYEGVAEKLFAGDFFFVSGTGEIQKSITSPLDPTNVTSERQGEKLLAINKLMNVAKFLNGDWQPDWSNNEQMKYFIVGKNEKSDLTIRMTSNYQSAIVYFKNEELIAKAIETLGEETIKLALCTDY